MIELKGIEKIYIRGSEEVYALKGINLKITKGEFVSIVGPSGSGKTTLMHILGCLDNPTKGIMKIDDIEVNKMSESELLMIRRKKIGFVFQQFYLIPKLTVFDNVSLPLLFSRTKQDKHKIISLLELVGLQDKISCFPNQLSGGEMQRVAIARALVNNPEVVLADEPTGNLDTENTERIFELFRSLYLSGLSVIMVTHNLDLATRAERVIKLRDGMIQ
ncbi:MAG: ABC transporter ATP-binding protein [Thermodesulfovibrionales bacterium]